MAKVSLEEQLQRQKTKTQDAIDDAKRKLRTIEAAQHKVANKKRVARWLEMGKFLDAWGLLDVDPDQLKAMLEMTQDLVLGQDHPARNGRPLSTLVLVGENGETLSMKNGTAGIED